MKFCRNCQLFFGQQVISCQSCKGTIEEISFSDALSVTRERSFHTRMTGQNDHRLSDGATQFYIRSYLKDLSLFLDFDIHKHRLMHGKAAKRFFIAPINFSCLINFPWLLYNVIASNIFQARYLGFCERCNCKIRPQSHTSDECDYNIVYFQILDDILSGEIVSRKDLYESYCEEQYRKFKRSAFNDLFKHHAGAEIFMDVFSVGLTIAFWIYLGVNVSWPMMQVLLQQLHQIDAYQLSIGS